MLLVETRRAVLAALMGIVLGPQAAARQAPGPPEEPQPKPHVLVTEGIAWERESRDRTAEAVGGLGGLCPELSLTRDFRNPADYVVKLDHSGAADGRTYRIAVYDREGQETETALAAISDPSLPEAIRRACEALRAAVRKQREKKSGSPDSREADQPYIEEKLDIRDRF